MQCTGINPYGPHVEIQRFELAAGAFTLASHNGLHEEDHNWHCGMQESFRDKYSDNSSQVLMGFSVRTFLVRIQTTTENRIDTT